MEWLKYCMKTSPEISGDFVRAVFLYYDGWDGVGTQKTIEKYQK